MNFSFFFQTTNPIRIRAKIDIKDPSNLTPKRSQEIKRKKLQVTQRNLSQDKMQKTQLKSFLCLMERISVSGSRK